MGIIFCSISEEIREYPELLIYELPIRQGTHVLPAELERRVRQGVGSGSEPPVADLFLLDAEAAKDIGRFREAVLFSWSTIDSVFNTAYDALVNERLVGERSESREHLQGKAGEMPLKVKMTAMLRLLSGRSLFSEQRQWQALNESYQRRNRIIHSGDNATEADAAQALVVARWVVEFMKNVRVQSDSVG